MKFILSIYDHSVMMHKQFHEDVVRCREVIALRLPKYQCILGNAHEYSLDCPKIYMSYCSLIALISLKIILLNYGRGYQFIVEFACSILFLVLIVCGVWFTLIVLTCSTLFPFYFCNRLAEQGFLFVFSTFSKEEGKYQGSIQSRPRTPNGNPTKTQGNTTYKRANRSAYS